MNLRSGTQTLCWSCYLQFIPHDMQFPSWYICDNFLATEHDKLAMDCSFDGINTTLFLFRFKQSAECHAVVTELRIVSNNLVAVAEIQNCRKQSGSYIIWHFPSWCHFIANLLSYYFDLLFDVISRVKKLNLCTVY